jgi:probable addiction module antidote protein
MPKRTRDYREGLLQSLLDPSTAAHYANAALEDSYEMLLIALRDIAEARQMTKVASEAGISRESIYRILSDTGNPRFNNLIGILKAVGLRLAIEPNIAPISSEGLYMEEQRIAELAFVAGSTQANNVRQDITDIRSYQRSGASKGHKRSLSLFTKPPNMENLRKII